MKWSHLLLAGAILTVGHFLASLLIIPLTLRIGEALADKAVDSFVYGVLTLATKVLYFPVLSMALFPRQWFPGQLITIPIAINSVLWGLVMVLLLVIGRHFHGRSKQ